MTKTIYDNTNLAESYAGTTTPLTFSFVRSVYADAYRHFSRMMGVRESTILREHEMYEHMIAMISGRLYYRLDLWYRLVSLLPGYRFNKSFFEHMLGVPSDNDGTGNRGSWRYFPRTLLQLLVITGNFLIMGRLVHGFIVRFRRQYDIYAKKDITASTLKELEVHYKHLCGALLSEWRIPIANDFAVMVSTGLLGVLGRGISEVDIYSALVQHARTPLISLDPGRKIQMIALEIVKYPALLRMLNDTRDDSSVLKVLRENAEYTPILRMIDTYIAEFGSRAPNELKLESETFTERPESIIALLRSSLHASSSHTQTDNKFIPPGFSLPRRLIFGFLLRWARTSIARREETRLCRSLIFGLARRIFLTAGERLYEAGKIAQPKDVFFLSVEEVFENADSRLSLAEKVKERQAALSHWKTCDMPSRIESEDDVQTLEELWCIPRTEQKVSQDQQDPLKGRVASKGGLEHLEGQTLVLTEFDPTANFHGKILVTVHTDPGWTIVFPLVRGIIVERGGMLSHAAIVARELGIPCIVGAEGATHRIASGGSVTMDLTSGVIHVKNEQT
jgi:pyruvate,water dikinase